jgi:hypothetical protein
VIHYTGNGFIMGFGEGCACHPEPRFPSVRQYNRTGSHLADLVHRQCASLGGANVDVLFIFDCCYRFAESRAARVSPNVVQVIAREAPNTDPRTGLSPSPPRDSITAKLAAEIKRRLDDGYRYLDFAALVATLRGKYKPDALGKADTRLERGSVAICMPLPSEITTTSIADPHPAPPPSTLRAVFSVQVSGLTKRNANCLVDRSNPREARLIQNRMLVYLRFYETSRETECQCVSDPEEPITVESLCPVGTMDVCFVLSSSWSVWSKVAG